MHTLTAQQHCRLCKPNAAVYLVSAQIVNLDAACAGTLGVCTIMACYRYHGLKYSWLSWQHSLRSPCLVLHSLCRYDVFLFSKPDTLLALVSLPVVKLMQLRYVNDSAAAMAKALQ